ncbi:hypothetical protein D1007_51178 [Hordeum vulgare]|nr:hypothetical protein D1007_51178 [Hordeum vulgare]
MTLLTKGFSDDQKKAAGEPVGCKNMNWCKFIADFLHDAFAKKMYQKGCCLHLMLKAKHAIDYNVLSGPHNFVKWLDLHSTSSCSTETTLAGFYGDTLARHFTSSFGERTHHSTGYHGRQDYNSSQELPDSQEELLGDGFDGVDDGIDKNGDDDMENVQPTMMNLRKFMTKVPTIRLHWTFLHLSEAMPQLVRETRVFLP